MTHVLLVALLVAQSVAAIVVLVRLMPGVRRPAPPVPRMDGPVGAVTIVLPTLNEAERLAPCLAGLTAQPSVVARILVVDSRSTDGTPLLVHAAAERDPRIQLLTDEPPPDGWIGKVWALQSALARVETPWVLGVDADIVPSPGLAAGALAAAVDGGYDVVSFAPRFAGMSAAERFVQPAILTSLVYRTGAPGDDRNPDRVLANGQCFLVRRDVLLEAGGYSAARRSWADDVTLARSLAARGARVGFLDGARLYDVHAYSSLGQMWREWGRSVDLKDATAPARQWLDVTLLFLAQALPLPLVIALGVTMRALGAKPTLVRAECLALLAVNILLVMVRLGVLHGLADSYERRGWSFWLSPLADMAAVFRIVLSTVRRPRAWRGRKFAVGS